jgi:hypothetical protein
MKLLFRRRRFVVNRKLQFSLLMISFSYAFFFLLVTGLALFVPLITQLDKADKASKQIFQVANQMLYLHDKFWPAALLCLVIIGLHSIRTSHRIAGPLYRLNMAFKTITNGIIPLPLRQPRKNDYLQEEFEVINETIQGLRTRISNIQLAQADFDNTINGYMNSINDASRDQLIANLKDLAAKENELKEKIEALKIES